MHAATGPHMIEKLIEVVTAELRRAASEAPAEAEVARAKAQMKAGMLMGLESSSARAEYQARQLLLFNRLIETEEVIRRIDAVTPEMVRALAAKLITSSESNRGGCGSRAQECRLCPRWPSAWRGRIELREPRDGQAGAE